MNLGPWNFNHSIIILRELEPDENPKEVILTKTLFWVLIYNLPLNQRTEVMARKLGNFLGTYKIWDEKEEHRLGNYFRIRIWIDVTKPLKRGTVIPRTGKPALKILLSTKGSQTSALAAELSTTPFATVTRRKTRGMRMTYQT